LHALDGSPIIAGMRHQAVFLFVLAIGCGRQAPPLSPENQLTRAQAKAVVAVKNYRPKVPIDVKDLAADVVPMLKQLPFVSRVERTGPANPTHRIIHLRDWHFVPEELAKVDGGEPFERQNLRVEIVQTEHAAILRCLARHHGLRSVHVEGYAPEMQALMAARIETLRDVEKVELSATKEERELIRQLRLEMGAAVCLVAEGDLEEVLPLENQKRLDEARPVRGGKVVVDAAKNAAREKAMIEVVKAHGPAAVIVLGGKHKLAAPDVEVIRVTTMGYPGE
jgi:hypothetical protein